MRLSIRTTPSLLQKFEATFEAYWDSAEFERYDPDLDRDRFDDALLEASGPERPTGSPCSFSGLEVRPYPYQQEMLDAIEASALYTIVIEISWSPPPVLEKPCCRLDYRRLSIEAGGDPPSLLFVAHRKEILEQSLRTYREVLADQSFGELYVVGPVPSDGATYSRACSRLPLTGWTRSRPMPTTLSSSTNFTMLRQRRIGGSSTTLRRGNSLDSLRRPSGLTGRMCGRSSMAGRQ